MLAVLLVQAGAWTGCELGVSLAGDGSRDDSGMQDDATSTADDATTSDDATPDETEPDADAPDVVLPLATCASLAADLVVPRDAARIEQAIDAAEPNDLICVEAGRYHEQVVLADKPLHIVGVAGPAATILDGDRARVVVWIEAPAGPDTVLEGFTICNGWSDSGPAAGIEITDASPTLRNLVVLDNVSDWSMAGGIRIAGFGSPTIADTIVAGNQSRGGGGGGLTIGGTLVTLENVLVAGNTAGGMYGGGMLIEGGPTASLVAHNVVVTGNNDGIWIRSEGAVALANLVVAGNHGTGVLAHGEGRTTLVNVSITDNTGAGLRNDLGRRVSAASCNAWGNGGGDVVGLVEDWAAGGNLSVDPDHLDVSSDHPALWNLHLSPGSPLVDAGHPDLLDPDGGRSDIGAWGGPGADDWDLDGDGFPSWWAPGPFDPARDVPLGLDCDDFQVGIGPGSGC